MAVSPRYALARSYLLSSNLAAVVNDDGGAARAVTVAASGLWVRPWLSKPSNGGTSGTDAIPVVNAASTGLTTGAGGGTWAVSVHTDGRTKVTWTGVGTGEIASGTLLSALGFAVGTGALSSGSSAYSDYPALGLVLWARSTQDTGWTPEQDSAGSEDGRGRSYVYRSPYVRWRRRLTARWVPREWSSNDTGEYHTPCWYADGTSAPTYVNTPSAPVPGTSALPWSWADSIFTLSGAVAWGFTDDVQGVLASTRQYADDVYLASEMLADQRFAVPEGAATYNARRDVLVSLTRTDTFAV